MKCIKVDYDREIRVYDDIFDLQFKQEIYTFAQNSFFRIGWADGSIIENQTYRYLHSTYTEEDVRRLGILDRIARTEAASELHGYKLDLSVLNLSTAADVNFIHAHPQDKVLLYYVNLEWKDGWHGETLFYGESLKDVAFASPYTPGRLISFDAKIPHTIRPQSHLASQYRMTLTLIFNKC